MPDLWRKTTEQQSRAISEEKLGESAERAVVTVDFRGKVRRIDRERACHGRFLRKS